MELIEIVDRKCCAVNFKASSKDEVLKKIAEIAVRSPLLEKIDQDSLYKQIKDREDQGSTGFGDGIAMPHARIEGMEKLLVFIITSTKGVEFDSLDKKKVKLIFVILGPAEAVQDHLKILATISRTLGSSAGVRNEIMKAQTNTALYEAFIRHSRLSTGGSAKNRKMKLLYVVLYIEDFLYDILEFFIEMGIDGTTIIESSGMGEYISNVPMFAEFIGFMQENKNRSKTLMTLIPEDKLDDVIEGIEEITGDLDKKQGAMIIVTDISYFKGTMKMM
ncbi:MAG: PTS sugar transporter subunit IIA [Spirochaetota bacterium]|nr:PTS sugar transporter subunit IIA [Spirochaetota bacterium]